MSGAKGAPRIGCVVLASGEGARFGGDKLMADFGGRPMLALTLACLKAARPPLWRIVVVTRSAEVARLAADMGVPSVLHALPDRSDTIRLGLRDMRAEGLDGCLFCVGDQPLLRRRTLEALMRAFAEDSRRIVRAACGETPGNPVLFPAELLPELERLAPGEAGDMVIRRHPERVRLVQVVSSDELSDVDTPEDLERLLAGRAPGADDDA